MTTTKITGLTPAHITMAVATGLPLAKQGKSLLVIDAAPADALTALDAAKANVVKDRGDANVFGTLRRKIAAAVTPADDATDAPAEPVAEPVVTDDDAEAVMVANADAEPVAFDAAATVDAYRSGMPWADRRAAVLALGDDERAAVFALFGQDEIEAYLDDAVLGVGMNPVFRSQVITRYEEIAPELGARARKAYEDNMPGTVEPVADEPADEPVAEPTMPRGTLKGLGIAIGDRATFALYNHLTGDYTTVTGVVERGDGESARLLYVRVDDDTRREIGGSSSRVFGELVERSTERPGPRTERKAREAAARRNTDAAPAEQPAAANPGRAGKGLKAQTLAWHAANPTTPAKAEELKTAFGAKWAGPIRIHQRNLAEAGLLVRVGDAKPETYVLAPTAAEDA